MHFNELINSATLMQNDKTLFSCNSSKRVTTLTRTIFAYTKKKEKKSPEMLTIEPRLRFSENLN